MHAQDVERDRESSKKKKSKYTPEQIKMVRSIDTTTCAVACVGRF
jgi:hypothetical protein